MVDEVVEAQGGGEAGVVLGGLDGEFSAAGRAAEEGGGHEGSFCEGRSACCGLRVRLLWIFLLFELNQLLLLLL